MCTEESHLSNYPTPHPEDIAHRLGEHALIHLGAKSAHRDDNGDQQGYAPRHLVHHHVLPGEGRVSVGPHPGDHVVEVGDARVHLVLLGVVLRLPVWRVGRAPEVHPTAVHGAPVVHYELHLLGHGGVCEGRHEELVAVHPGDYRG